MEWVDFCAAQVADSCFNFCLSHDTNLNIEEQRSNEVQNSFKIFLCPFHSFSKASSLFVKERMSGTSQTGRTVYKPATDGSDTSITLTTWDRSELY